MQKIWDQHYIEVNFWPGTKIWTSLKYFGTCRRTRHWLLPQTSQEWNKFLPQHKRSQELTVQIYILCKTRKAPCSSHWTLNSGVEITLRFEFQLPHSVLTTYFVNDQPWPLGIFKSYPDYARSCQKLGPTFFVILGQTYILGVFFCDSLDLCYDPCHVIKHES